MIGVANANSLALFIPPPGDWTEEALECIHADLSNQRSLILDRQHLLLHHSIVFYTATDDTYPTLGQPVLLKLRCSGKAQTIPMNPTLHPDPSLPGSHPGLAMKQAPSAPVSWQQWLFPCYGDAMVSGTCLWAIEALSSTLSTTLRTQMQIGPSKEHVSISKAA